MTLKSWVVIVITLIINLPLTMAQTKHTDANLTGHIIDIETREHIPYAIIGIKGTTVGGSADATGHFFLKNLPLGTHTITVSLLGYESAEKTITIEPRKTMEVNFELQSLTLHLGDVVVSGSRNETNRRESSTVVGVLSAKIFEKTASNCVADVLGFQSGLRVESSCNNCGSTELRINGLGGQYSQILLDSRPIFSSLAGVYGLEQLPIGMVERVEVIRGGGSALFGSSAIGGVVNIITKEPQRNTVSLSNNTGVFSDGKTEINTSLNAAFVTDDDKAGVYIFGMIRSKDAYDRDKDGFTESPELSSETLGFRGYYRLTPSSRLTAEYHHIREYRRGGNKLDRPAHEADIAEQLRHNINGGGLKYDIFSKNYRHRGSIYTSAQNINRNSYFGTHQDPNAFGSTKDFTFIIGGQYTCSFLKAFFMPSDLTVGLEYSDNTLHDKIEGYNRDLNQRSICYGTFFQNEWKSEKFSLLLGGRLDKHNKMNNPVFNPRANVRYSPIKEIGLRLSHSSGYRAPQAYDEDLHVNLVQGEASIVVLDPNLKPEYSNSISASVDLYKSFSWMESNLLIEGFYTDIKDIFILEDIGHDANGNKLLERKNAPGAIVKGINLELKLGFTSKFIIDAGYTFQSSRYKVPTAWSADPDIEPSKRMFRAPNQYGYVSLNYNPIKKLALSLSGNYTGSMLVQHFAGYITKDKEETVSGFFDMGVRVAYDISISQQVTLQISGGVKNMFDSYQSDIDKGINRDSGYIYGPAMPRMFYIGAKFTM